MDRLDEIRKALSELPDLTLTASGWLDARYRIEFISRELEAMVVEKGELLEVKNREILDLEATVGSLNIILGDIYGRAWDGLKEIENG